MADQILALQNPQENAIVPYTDAEVNQPDGQEHGLLLQFRQALQNALTNTTSLPLWAHAWGVQARYNHLNGLIVQAFGGLVNVANREWESIVPATVFCDLVIPFNRQVENRLNFPAADGVAHRRNVVLMAFQSHGALDGLIARLYEAPPAEGVVDRRAATIRALDPYIANNALVPDFNPENFLRDWNAYLEAERRDEWGSYLLTRLIEGVFCFVQRGNASPQKIRKLQEALGFNEGVDINLTPETVGSNYNYLSSYLEASGTPTTTIFRNIATVFTPEVCLRVKLMVAQAKGAGSAPVTITLDAIRQFQDHPVWGYLARTCPQEFTAFKEAARYLARNPFVQYNEREMQTTTRGTNFPSFIIGAMTIQRTMGMGKTLRGYKGRFESRHVAKIESLCEQYRAHVDQEVDMALYLRGADGHLNWQTELEDLNHIINSIENLN